MYQVEYNVADTVVDSEGLIGAVSIQIILVVTLFGVVESYPMCVFYQPVGQTLLLLDE